MVKNVAEKDIAGLWSRVAAQGTALGCNRDKCWDDDDVRQIQF